MLLREMNNLRRNCKPLLVTEMSRRGVKLAPRVLFQVAIQRAWLFVLEPAFAPHRDALVLS